MKKFCDLHLLPDLNKREQIEKLVSKASELDYSLIGVSLPSKVRQDTLQFLRKSTREHNVDFVTRIDLTPKSSNELLKSLRKFRRKFELTSVYCFSKAVARQAAKDHRVDMITFPSGNPKERFFDPAEARLAAQGVAAFEVDMSLLLKSNGFFRVRLLSCLRREAALAEKFDIPIVISSGAVDCFQLRGPRDIASLAMVFGMNHMSALEAISTTPFAIVERNRGKLDPSYVARGIRIVRRGKDCGK